MPDPNLILDVVNFVSLVDDPAVGDSEWVVMKRADGQQPENIQEALEMAEKGRAQGTDKTDGGDTDMDDEKLEELVKSVAKSAEAAEQAAESAESAAEAAQEASVETSPEGEAEGQGGEGQEETPDISSEVLDRIESLETRLQEQGVLGDGEGEEAPEGEAAEATDGGGSAEEAESDVEKRLASIEKSLEQGGRKGTAGVEVDRDDVVKTASGVEGKDTLSAVQKFAGGQGEGE